MKKHIPLLLILSGLALSLLTAQNPARTGTDHALFFAVKDFDHWQDFDEHSVQQVREIEKELKDNYGFRTRFELNPTRNDVLSILREYQQKHFYKKDQLFIYFSMHGHYEEGQTGALIPKDGPLKDPFQDSWIYHPLLEGMVNSIPCEHITIALDACYSGTFAGARGRPETLAFKVSNDCAAKASNALRHKSRLYLTSGGKERTSINSQFAERWLEALRLRNDDGVLSHNDLVGVLEDANPIPRYGEFKGHVKGGNFVFVHKYTCASSGQFNNLQADKDAWATAKTENSLVAYRRYLSRYPNGEFSGLARQRIALKEKEQREATAWQQAKDKNTAKGYTDFISQYPNSDFREVAEFNRFQLQGSKATVITKPEKPADLTDFKFVQGGTFQMGSNDGDDDEKPVHSVTVSDFYMGIHEVTFEEYDAFCIVTNREKPSDEGWGRGKRPVINVDWYDAVEYCNWRSEKERLQKVYTINKSKKDPNNSSSYDDKKWTVTANWNANGYRLPTEAEWEYAARSHGGKDKWAGTSTESSLSKYANGSGEADGYKNTAPVGSFNPNSLGLHDMSGNVWEWCWDWKATYSSSAKTNPHGSDKGFLRVLRGGSWNSIPASLRCAYRNYFLPNLRYDYLGFRLARAAR